MIKPGQVVKKVEIVKSDNCGDDTGVDGYDITIYFEGTSEVIFTGTTQRSVPWIHELDDKPNGLYNYDGEEFIMIENWEE